VQVRIPKEKKRTEKKSPLGGLNMERGSKAKVSGEVDGAYKQ